MAIRRKKCITMLNIRDSLQLRETFPTHKRAFKCGLGPHLKGLESVDGAAIVELHRGAPVGAGEVERGSGVTFVRITLKVVVALGTLFIGPPVGVGAVPSAEDFVLLFEALVVAAALEVVCPVVR